MITRTTPIIIETVTRERLVLVAAGGPSEVEIQAASRAYASATGTTMTDDLERAGLVPRGREVEPPAMLRRENLPLKPPTRRT